MLEALENGVKGGKWHSLIDKVWREDNLRFAYQAVRRNKGAPGIDRQSVQRFGNDLNRQLERLHRELKEDRYTPKPALRKWIEKPGRRGEKRPLGIPAVRDRVVEAALKQVIEPIFEREFCDCSHGFRPGRGTKSALREVDQSLKSGYGIVVEVDIRGFFDHLSHDLLMGRINEKISDSRVLKLIGMILTRGVMEEGEIRSIASGVPQGGVLSPLLANIYLNELDHQLADRNHRVVRYADDLVVLCRSQSEAQRVLEMMERWLRANGLELHPEKTGVVDMSVKGNGFDFLGYRFERTRRKGRLARWPSKKACKRLRERLKPWLRRSNWRSIEEIIFLIDPILRGWYQHFKHASGSGLQSIDEWVRMRLRSILRTNEKRRGRGRGKDHQKWPISYFTSLGLFSLQAARDEALQSLRG
jgi:RNA-directed DNA polymerase